MDFVVPAGLSFFSVSRLLSLLFEGCFRGGSRRWLRVFCFSLLCGFGDGARRWFYGIVGASGPAIELVAQATPLSEPVVMRYSGMLWFFIYKGLHEPDLICLKYEANNPQQPT